MPTPSCSKASRLRSGRVVVSTRSAEPTPSKAGWPCTPTTARRTRSRWHGPSADRLDPSAVRQVIEERLLGFPRFRQRVAEAPFGMGPPQWSSDRRFELDAHLHRVALPEPGDKGALEAFVSDLMSTPLDFTKPLWQIHLVDYGR